MNEITVPVGQTVVYNGIVYKAGEVVPTTPPLVVPNLLKEIGAQNGN